MTQKTIKRNLARLEANHARHCRYFDSGISKDAKVLETLQAVYLNCKSCLTSLLENSHD